MVFLRLPQTDDRGVYTDHRETCTVWDFFCRMFYESDESRMYFFHWFFSAWYHDNSGSVSEQEHVERRLQKEEATIFASSTFLLNTWKKSCVSTCSDDRYKKDWIKVSRNENIMVGIHIQSNCRICEYLGAFYNSRSEGNRRRTKTLNKMEDKGTEKEQFRL